jgi:Skp family chaperone for outer membrane proteins
MRLALIVAVLALAAGFGAGYLLWGERAKVATDARRQAIDDLDSARAEHAEELRKLRAELEAERLRRQRLEEALSQGRK